MDTQQYSVQNSEQELDELLANVLQETDKKQRALLYQQFLRTKEAMEELSFTEHPTSNSLYPHVQDPMFAVKLASKKEFQDTEQEDVLYDPKTRGSELASMEFELAPHQQFVRNFLSSHTPYNSLLLFHGLGTGKTCSAISVCEEVREYMKQKGDTRRILIVASPNVQGNFKRQLFDSRKLKEVNGMWMMRTCTGSSFLKEINPMNVKGMTLETIEKQVNKIISQSYVFMGYQQFGNYIDKLIARATSGFTQEEHPDLYKQRKQAILKKEFSHRMVVIDEVHNIRISDDNTDKKVAERLLDVVNISESMKLLLLSATPMFNSYREILWLLNLMNMNDKRARIRPRDVFTKSGDFVVKGGREIGKELLLSKSRGYVSYVRGENPYSFPYRIFPSDFDPEHTFSTLDHASVQVNGKQIDTPLQYIDVYLNALASYQEQGYMYILKELAEEFPSFDDVEKGLGYQALNRPVQALNILYPMKQLDRYLRDSKKQKPDTRELVGKAGLARIMDYESGKQAYEYNSDILARYGRIFHEDHLGKYSAKIANILRNLRQTARPRGTGGVSLMYSEYIDGGCVPMALALEEMGFRRYGARSSLLKNPSEAIDALTFLPRSQYREEDHGRPFKQATYVMITGDKDLSPDGNNDREVKAVTADTNLYGEEVRAIIMSKAGSEGLDFRFIRQVHILDPWFNMNRIEQIIGRAVRTFSHIDLPFEERNVQIFLYASMLSIDVEAVDVYVYRLAEQKAIQIGKVARLLKENAIDCRLNYPTTSGLTAEVFQQTVPLMLADGTEIEYQVGDKPYTATCDYMDTCAYRCLPFVEDTTTPSTSTTPTTSEEIMAIHRKERQDRKDNENLDTYQEHFLANNTDKLKRMIGKIIGTQYIVHKNRLLKTLTKERTYPLSLLYTAIQQLVENDQEIILDANGRSGHVRNLGKYYVFQPIELSNPRLSFVQRARPLDVTFDHVRVSWTDTLREVEKEEASAVNHLEDLTENLVRIQRKQSLATGERSWYALASHVLDRVESNKFPFSVSNQEFLYYTTCHYIESLFLEDKLALFRSKEPSQQSLKVAYQLVQQYLDERMLTNKKKTQHAFYSRTPTDTGTLYIQEEEFREASPSESLAFQDALANYQYELSDYSRYIGFMFLFKEKEYVFKVKDIEKKGHKGARCDQANKGISLTMMNAILKQVGKEGTYSTASMKPVSKFQLCVEQEILLRHLHATTDTVWFMSPEEALENKIEKLYRPK